MGCIRARSVARSIPRSISRSLAKSMGWHSVPKTGTPFKQARSIFFISINVGRKKKC